MTREIFMEEWATKVHERRETFTRAWVSDSNSESDWRDELLAREYFQ